MKLSIQSLETCLDPTIAGRKGAGLARLLQAGFAVPPGCCVTTEAYLHACARVGLDLRHDWESIRSLPADQRRTVLSAARAGLLAFPWPAEWSADLEEAIGKVRPVPISFWAVRSSATDEDAADASAAGLYRTQLGIRSADLAQAILHCWASTWEERVFDYWVAKGTSRPEPAMAVVLQPMVEARVSGVAFSRHPIAGRGDEILINAVPGLAEPLVSGRVTPDEYVVTLNSSGGSGSVSRRHLSRKAFMMSLTADGLMLKRLAKQDGHRESLTDNEAIQLAAAVRKAEQALGFPVDVEWAFDQQHLWFLQARPIPIRQGEEWLTNEPCDWSRANFKETHPELPSPLGLSFLEVFMEDFILRHYRELGCVVPDGWSAVRIVEGRPFINVTLVQSFQVQLGGHPELVTEHMGGSSRMPPAEPGRLSFWRLARAYFVMHRKIRRALREAPAWFGELKRTGLEQIDGALHTLSSQELVRRVEWLGDRLRQGECTFAIVAAVGQAQQILGLLLPRWLGSDWRALLDAALQGQETIVSARQVQWLRQIGERARHDARAIAFFQSEPWKPASYRERLAGTDCLVELEKFLTEYGHRAIGESDLMVPRFAEDPSYLLEVIRRHIADASGLTADQTTARQRRERMAALALIRRRCGWRYDRWL
ncbi:MAG TPA: PEP/pyruvate-binding domain-containing protein, partial [Nitrospiraceae bacterium]|nr:PEP/pyruvate-binding domain-containing protein [Nitrospiraceae bacterium]